MITCVCTICNHVFEAEVRIGRTECPKCGSTEITIATAAECKAVFRPARDEK